MSRLSIISFFLTLFAIPVAFGSHNRAGEITYKHIQGLTYEITVTTYSDPKGNVDRCALYVEFGDGQADSIYRVNGAAVPRCNFGGELIKGGTVRQNIYTTRHTYSGPGEYLISMSDPNRVAGIDNIPNSENFQFSIRSLLVINPVLGNNSSPQLTILPLDEGCICQPYEHNPGAFDTNGDSLSYSITECFNEFGEKIPGYSFPNPSKNCGGKIFTIDQQTGTLLWDAPGYSGTFNVCILITEWRKMKNQNTYLRVGNVLRDMQVNISPCNNEKPVVNGKSLECVIARQEVKDTLRIQDDGFQIVQLLASGEPFSLLNSPAKQPTPSSGVGNWKSIFSWQTECVHIRERPYNVVFRAEDDNPLTPLATYFHKQIKVIGPSVTNLQVTPTGRSFQISWNSSVCANAIAYEVYRKIESTNWIPSNCETGIPPSLGFKKIGRVTSGTLKYLDQDLDLKQGNQYCYRIVPIYPGEVEGKSSIERCGEFKFDAPLWIKNSIGFTSENRGIDTLGILKPREVDLNQFPPPYQVKLFQFIDGNRQPLLFTPLYASWTNIDTVFRIENINTLENNIITEAELYSGNQLIGTTGLSESIYLEAESGDDQVLLRWSSNSPWVNHTYRIERKEGTSWKKIVELKANNYEDNTVFNGQEYVYRVIGYGYYTGDFVKTAAVNFSQEVRVIPEDRKPPCAPQDAEIKAECENGKVEVLWNDVNQHCEDKDVAFYRVYFANQIGNNYELVLENSGELKFEEFDKLSVAGCYRISSVDSSGNESDLSKAICTDNCPRYELPNVFTPGNDGYNDLFTPIYPVRQIQSVKFKVMNRWGQIVFETGDYNLNWNGLDQTKGQLVKDGVYFYSCVVKEIRLSGIVSRKLSGNITVIRDSEVVDPRSH